MTEVWLRRPADVAFVEGDDVVYLARMPAGPIQVLEGSALAIWQEVPNGARATLADRVAARTGVAVELIQADVTTFVAVMVSLGLLAEHEGRNA